VKLDEGLPSAACCQARHPTPFTPETRGCFPAPLPSCLLTLIFALFSSAFGTVSFYFYSSRFFFGALGRPFFAITFLFFGAFPIMTHCQENGFFERPLFSPPICLVRKLLSPVPPSAKRAEASPPSAPGPTDCLPFFLAGHDSPTSLADAFFFFTFNSYGGPRRSPSPFLSRPARERLFFDGTPTTPRAFSSPFFPRSRRRKPFLRRPSRPLSFGRELSEFFCSLFLFLKDSSGDGEGRHPLYHVFASSSPES